MKQIIQVFTKSLLDLVRIEKTELNTGLTIELLGLEKSIIGNLISKVSKFTKFELGICLEPIWNQIIPFSSYKNRNVKIYKGLGNKKEYLCNGVVTQLQVEAAKPNSWKIIEMPEDNKSIFAYERKFSVKEFNRLRLGEIPGSMDDKWFVYFENDWLYLHRSWTGVCVFQLNIQNDGEIYFVNQSYLNNSDEQKMFSQLRILNTILDKFSLEQLYFE